MCRSGVQVSVRLTKLSRCWEQRRFGWFSGSFLSPEGFFLITRSKEEVEKDKHSWKIWSQESKKQGHSERKCHLGRESLPALLNDENIWPVWLVWGHHNVVQARHRSLERRASWVPTSSLVRRASSASQTPLVREKGKLDANKLYGEEGIYIYKTVVFVCVLTLYRPCAYPGAVLRHASGPTGPPNSESFRVDDQIFDPGIVQTTLLQKANQILPL